MATSQNGWPAYTSGTDPNLVAIPEVAGRVRKGDVATIFTWLVKEFDRTVEKVSEAAGQPQDDWGFASRPIRGKTTGLSNHASGTAIDLNATKHPLGKVNTFNANQRAAIRNILNFLEGVVRWGGDYSGRKDEMHFEINANAANVARIARKIQGVAAPVTKPVTPATPAKSIAQLADEVMAGKHGNGDARKRSLGANYAAVQAEVNRRARGGSAPVRKPTKSIGQLADEVIAGKHGNGDARRRSLGSNYAAVQAEVNRRMR